MTYKIKSLFKTNGRLNGCITVKYSYELDKCCSYNQYRTVTTDSNSGLKKKMGVFFLIVFNFELECVLK